MDSYWKSVSEVDENWVNNFPEEEFCNWMTKNELFMTLLPCKKCGFKHYHWKKRKAAFECKACKNRISIKSLTPFAGSKLPLDLWYKASCILIVQPDIQVTKLQQLLKITRYATALHVVTTLRDILFSVPDHKNYKIWAYDQAIDITIKIIFGNTKDI